MKSAKPLRKTKADKEHNGSKDELIPNTAQHDLPPSKRIRRPQQSALSVLKEATLAVGNLALETKRDSRLMQKGLMRAWKLALSKYFDNSIEVFLGTPLDDQPSLRTWSALNMDLLSLPAKPETAQAVKTIRAHTLQDPSQWQKKVHYCLVKHTFDEKFIRICVWTDLLKELEAVNLLLLDLGASAQWETPPRSARERKAANALTKLAKTPK